MRRLGALFLCLHVFVCFALQRLAHRMFSASPTRTGEGMLLFCCCRCSNCSLSCSKRCNMKQATMCHKPQITLVPGCYIPGICDRYYLVYTSNTIYEHAVFVFYRFYEYSKIFRPRIKPLTYCCIIPGTFLLLSSEKRPPKKHYEQSVSTGRYFFHLDLPVITLLYHSSSVGIYPSQQLQVSNNVFERGDDQMRSEVEVLLRRESLNKTSTAIICTLFLAM